MNKTQRIELKAQKRTVLGKKVKDLRTQGWLPASIYGKGFESVSVQLPKKESEIIFDEVGEAGLVDLLIDGGERIPILFKNPQYDPIEGDLIHVDLHKVNLKEKISASVPIELIGESQAVKAGNVLIEVTMEVEVEALPTDLPEKFVVDLAKLAEVNMMITVADLEVDKKRVEIKTDADQVIVKVAAPKEEVIEEPVAPTPTEVPATEQKAPEEGAETAEGTATAKPVSPAGKASTATTEKTDNKGH